MGYRTIFTQSDGSGKGCGFAKNQAIRVSHGKFLAFTDADDIHCPKRLLRQVAAARERPNAIVGCQFTRFGDALRFPPAAIYLHQRVPADATPRYTQWANTLTQAQLYAQQYREVTVLQPTWFLSRQVYDNVGGYNPQKGCPEDLVRVYIAHLGRCNNSQIFFLAHLGKGGELYRVDEVLLCKSCVTFSSPCTQPLIVYRYHPEATSLGIHRMELIKLRIAAFEPYLNFYFLCVVKY